ncbi:MAG: hypothetical protein CMH56_11945 [Myxococcales bacterium]|nr:hypothetical protein [Myxococcales bacterium]
MSMRWSHISMLGFLVLGTSCVGQMWKDYQFEQSAKHLPEEKKSRLRAFAKLPAHTFTEGPKVGQGLAEKTKRYGYFDKGQPVMGFSSLVARDDGTFLSVVDNGFGHQHNSVDFLLRVYKLRPDFRTDSQGTGQVQILDFTQLADPDGHIDFPIVNHFTSTRELTGADFDLEAMVEAPDGTWWFGDGFGPFLLHTDQTGKLLEPPYPIQLNGAPPWVAIESPLVEEGNVLRLIQAFYSHGKEHGAHHRPIIAPSHLLLRDKIKKTFLKSRKDPPEETSLKEASSEIFNMRSLRKAGFLTVPYTVNKKKRMKQLLSRGVAGMITDRPDRLYDVLKKSHKKKKGDFLDSRGLIDPNKFLAVGHRGAKGLLPENTLPSIEKALDHLMNTIEIDVSITADSVAVINHDLSFSSKKCRRADREPYGPEDEKWIFDLTSRFILSQMICDKEIKKKKRRKPPKVASAFAKRESMPSAYSVISLYQVLQFVAAYEAYYVSGEGATHKKAALRAANARQVKFHIEVKRNPREDKDQAGRSLSERSANAAHYALSVGWLLRAFQMEDRARLQSFDFNTLLEVQRYFPEIQTVYLFGDSPLIEGSNAASGNPGVNLQSNSESENPFLAGLSWPYRQSWSKQKIRIRKRGGISGLAFDANQNRLVAILEKPLQNEKESKVKILSFNLSSKKWSDTVFDYSLSATGKAVDDWVWVGGLRFLALERDSEEGALAGHKMVFDVSLNEADQVALKRPLVDLMHVFDPADLVRSEFAIEQDDSYLFQMPFSSIGGLAVLDRHHIAVVNDNNYPMGRGRYPEQERPDDSEMVVIQLAQPLW